jgi:hypothetical protein
MMKHLLLVAAIIYAVYTFAPSTPAPVVKTGPVADALRSATPQDKQTVASIYESLADITRRDGGKRISTTAEWRAVHQNTLGLAVGGTDLVGKYPGLDVAVEEVIGKHISLDNVALSSVVDDLVAACEEVAASAR